MNKKYLLEISNLGKHYSNENNLKIEIIKNLNFKLMQNSKVAIVGPSGSGKTTFLNIIGLLDSEYDGKVYFKNKDISLCSKDETNNINVIIWKHMLERFHAAILQGQLLLIQGTLERESSVIHIIAKHVTNLSHHLENISLQSRDFH